MISVKMDKPLMERTWVKSTISLVSLGAIIGIYFALKNSTFEWSLTAIDHIQDSHGDALKNFCVCLNFFGGQFPNIFVISVFCAMFKRRHHAFSYVVLWNLQVFFDTFFKLVLHEARPSMVSEIGK